MRFRFAAAGAAFLVAALLAGCDVLDYQPKAQPDALLEDRLSAVIELTDAPDTLYLWGSGASLQYTVSSPYNGNVTVRYYVDDIFMGEVQSGSPIEIDLANLTTGLHELSVRAYAQLGRNDSHEGKPLLGELRRFAHIEPGSLNLASDLQVDSASGYMTLKWKPSSSRSVFGYALHYRGHVDTVYGGSSSSWTDSVFVGGSTTYSVETLSSQGKAPLVPFELHSRDFSLLSVNQEPEGIRLEWQPSAFPRAVRALVVERKILDGSGPIKRDTLHDTSITTFLDPTMQLGPNVTYTVRASATYEQGCVSEYTHRCFRRQHAPPGGSLLLSPGLKVPAMRQRYYDPSTGTLVGLGAHCGWEAGCLMRVAVGGSTPIQQYTMPTHRSAVSVAEDGQIYMAVDRNIFKLDPATLAPIDTVTTAQIAKHPLLHIDRISAARNGMLALKGSTLDSEGRRLDTRSIYVGSFEDRQLLAIAKDQLFEDITISADAQYILHGYRYIYRYFNKNLHIHKTLDNLYSTPGAVGHVITHDLRKSIISNADEIIVYDIHSGTIETRFKPRSLIFALSADPATGHIGGLTPEFRYHVYRLSDGALLHDIPVAGSPGSYALFNNVLYYGADRCLVLE